MAEESWSSRDLYLCVADLIKREDDNRRTLEEYLRALWAKGQCLPRDTAVACGRLTRLLADAFHGAPAPFEASWTRTCRGFCGGESGFELWRRTLLSQIVDLREMAAAGTLDDEQRYFGVDAPSGLRWYNFDPSTFLECAAMGTWGGWEPGDGTGRDYVPGKVMVVDEAGRLVARDPREVEEPAVVLEGITWDHFAEFLRAGQWYE